MFRHWALPPSQRISLCLRGGSPNPLARHQCRQFAQTARCLKENNGSSNGNSKPTDNESVDVQNKPQGGVVWKSLSDALSSSDRTTRPPKSVESPNSKNTDSNQANSKASTRTRGKNGKGRGTRSKSKGSKASEGSDGLHVHKILPAKLELKHVPTDDKKLPPRLCHKLDRTLFNPGGAYHMQDPRSRVYNFDPYLATIMPVEEFDYDALKEYITSSKDTKLRDLAAAHKKKYCGSTSSLTAVLGHFHFLFSAWRMPRMDNLSKMLEIESKNFTQILRAPAAVFAHLENGVYAIDADKQHDSANILSTLGKSLEKLLTLPRDDFEKYRRSKSHQLTEEEKNAEEPYYYSTLGDFMMRSQLDAYDPRLPGTGVFDLKTRAVVSIRMDVKGYKKGVGYEIRERYGQWDSFEREYYDLIRAAFLKYSLQVRMGSMDGVFVAFHDTHRIFGFQYISLAEMDYALHGTADTRLGDQEFKASIKLLNELMDKATERFPGKTLRICVETRPTKVPLTYFFAEPVTDEEMRSMQEKSNESAENVVKDIQSINEEQQNAELTVESEEAESAESEAATEAEQAEPVSDAELELLDDIQNEAAWGDMMAKVDETVESESLGIKSVREAVQDALEKSGLFQGKTELEREKYSDELATSLAKYSLESRDLRDAARQELEEATENEKVEETQAESQSEADKSLATLILKVAESMSDKEADLDKLQRIFAGQSSSTEVPQEQETSDKTPVEDASEEAASAENTEENKEILGMYVTIRNKVNGKYVERAEGGDNVRWAIEYAITELADESAQRIYKQVNKRRRSILDENPQKSREWYRMFRGQLPARTREGRKFREARRKEEGKKMVQVAWLDEPWALTNASSNKKKDTQESSDQRKAAEDQA